MARRGPVADWPTPENGANPTAQRKAWRERSREERLVGMCHACGERTLSDEAYLCARCWRRVPACFREHVTAAVDALCFGNPARAEYGDSFPPELGWALRQQLDRRLAVARLACEIAARIFAEGGGEI